jgi:hypothetical protein
MLFDEERICQEKILCERFGISQSYPIPLPASEAVKKSGGGRAKIPPKFYKCDYLEWQS